jgi:hypothetical protein
MDQNLPVTRLSVSWKLFRIICILQLILIVCQGAMYIGSLFYAGTAAYSFLVIALFTIIWIFVYQGLSILNYNYPATPLTVKQKRYFNWLFLLNFLLIAFLFARLVNVWWVVPVLFMNETVHAVNLFWFITPFLLSFLTFIFHMILLAGFFMLRRTIHQRTIASWYQQFDENKAS